MSAPGPTVADQLAALRRGEVTSEDLTRAALARAHAAQARLNCFVRLDDAGALDAARAADARRAAGGDAALLGVPVAVKDDLDAAGEVTGWGSRATRRPATDDAPSVAALRRAGAVVLGRTTLPELAAFGVTDSAAHGVTRHPDDPDRSPGGSSGGSAAAVAAGVVAAATASDGAGSIRLPAACCGLVGLKPTTGAVPGESGWGGLATQGCLTRSVADTALVLEALGHPDELTAAAASPGPPPGLRIGVDTTPLPLAPPLALDPWVAGAVRRAADALADLGYRVRPVRVDRGLAAPAVSARILAALHTSAAAVDEPERLERRVRDLARLGGAVPAGVLAAARRHGARWGARVLPHAGVDVLLTPTMRTTAPAVDRWGLPSEGTGRGGLATLLGMGRVYAHTPAWNHSGHPALSVPAGRHPDGLPLAVQLVAGHGREDLLLALGAALEAGLASGA